jgi:glyoxylase-like metal-dependent hydrolase (beta-lactamase superfamily II)
MINQSTSFTIGNISCQVLWDSPNTSPAPCKMICANAPPKALEQALAKLQLTDTLPTDLNCLLLETKGQLMLIEAGSVTAFWPGSGQLTKELQAIGVTSEDIDTVILTHAHVDHFGGLLTEAGEVVFPKARVVLSKVEWDFWLGQPSLIELPVEQGFREWTVEMALRHLNALEKYVELVDDGSQVAPGVRAVAAPGHTPGHLAIEIENESERLWFIGDLVYHLIQLENPDWYSVFDFAPEQAVATRRELCEKAAREKILLMGYHLPFPGVGYVVQRGKGWQWLPMGSD